jgi:hypothetical protein
MCYVPPFVICQDGYPLILALCWPESKGRLLNIGLILDQGQLAAAVAGGQGDLTGQGPATAVQAAAGRHARRPMQTVETTV